MPAKGKSLCPGCKRLKQNHAFAALSKDYAGPLVMNEILDDESSEGEELPPCKGKFVSSPSAESGPQKQLASQQLLDMMQNLSLQLKKSMEKVSAGNTTKTTREDTSHCSSPGASDSLLPVKQAAKALHLLDKFTAATINGEYMDFSEVLSSLSVLGSNYSNKVMLQMLSGDQIPIARPPRKNLVDSFDV